jgi:hypothetical protein
MPNEDFYNKMKLISSYIQQYLSENNIAVAQPKDVMEYLIANNIYKSDNRAGQPLRKDLRTLRAAERLDLIEGLECKTGKTNTFWFFRKI